MNWRPVAEVPPGPGRFYIGMRVLGRLIISRRNWDGEKWDMEVGDTMFCWLYVDVMDERVEVISSPDGSLGYSFPIPNIPKELLR